MLLLVGGRKHTTEGFRKRKIHWTTRIKGIKNHVGVNTVNSCKERVILIKYKEKRDLVKF